MLAIQPVDDSGLTVLSSMLKLLRNQKPVYKAIGKAMVPVIDKRFETKLDPAGVRWAPWAESTRAQREAEGFGTLMEHYGEERKSLTANVDSTGVEIGFGEDIFYARLHEQIDTTRKEVGKMPRRGILFNSRFGGLSESDSKVVLTAILNTFESNLKASA